LASFLLELIYFGSSIKAVQSTQLSLDLVFEIVYVREYRIELIMVNAFFREKPILLPYLINVL